MCAIRVDRDLLAQRECRPDGAAVGPEDRACVLTVPTHHLALAVAFVSDSLVIGLDTGVLVIRLNAAA